MKLDLHQGQWLNEPATHTVTTDTVTIVTPPETDLWQRTYYGFRNDNAPALLFESAENFTWTVHTTFQYSVRFDQCGLLIYLDSDNWFKASIEYEDHAFSRLGSVVTNQGYSDWATQDIATITAIWYRLSRRGPDFLIESSLGGLAFRQMRIFHLHALGETTAAMGQAHPPQPAAQAIRFGLYACSPMNSSFTATFSGLTFEPCRWQAHPVA